MNEKNKNNIFATEQQGGARPKNDNSVYETDAITDHDEGNTDNGELGGNFATFDRPIESLDSEKK